MKKVAGFVVRVGLFLALGLLACGKEEKEKAAVSEKNPTTTQQSHVPPFPIEISGVIGKEVDFVVYKPKQDSGEVAAGDIAKVRVEVGPNPTKEPRVSADGDLAEGSGASWRATAYMASALAATSLGKQLSDYHFAVYARGTIDGPSGGALVAATLMALLTGQDIRSDVAITGALNPDGSIAPVDGLPEKLTAAVRNRKVLFGYPKGQTMASDSNHCSSDEKHHVNCTMVDIQEQARLAHIQAEEITDIYDAYRLLTGKRLQYPDALERAELEKADLTSLKHSTEQWLQRAESIFTTTIQRKKGQYPSLSKDVEQARKNFGSAKNFYDQSQVPAAYRMARKTVMKMAAIAQLIEVLDQRGNIDAMNLKIRNNLEVKRHLKAFKEQIDASRPQSLASALSHVQAYAYLHTSQTWIDLGDQRLAALLNDVKAGKIKLVQPEQWAKLAIPILCFVIAELQLDSAKDLYRIADKTGKPFGVSEAALSRLAVDYISVADANHTYYHSLPKITDKINDNNDLNKRPDEHWFEHSIHDAALKDAIKHRGDVGMAAALMNLGAAISSHIGFSRLVVDEYSLESDDETVVQLRLSRLLDHAERRTLEESRATRDLVHTIPASTAILYQRGRSGREGDTESKKEALNSFWEASSLARLAVFMEQLSQPTTTTGQRN